MIQFDYLSFTQAALLFLALALPSVWLGRRSMVALGPVRQWVAIAARVLVLALCVLILAGARIERTNKDVEVMVLRDVSRSTQLVQVTGGGGDLRAAIDSTLRKMVADDRERKSGDRVGLISFDREASVDAPPAHELILDARGTRDASANATDVGSALQLAMATMSREAMNRIVLIWDGNQTLGDLDAAVRQAASKRIPIDVMPLEYEARNEVIVERFISPTWRKENEPFTIDVVLRSTNPGPVTGSLRIRHQGSDLDLDPAGPGTTRTVTLRPGSNVERVQVPPLTSGGVHEFEAIFEAPNVTTEIAGQRRAVPSGDTVRDNNTASTFTFVRGKGQVLFVSNVPNNGGRALMNALVGQGINVDPNRTTVDQFPTSLIELQNYDSVILANVPRGRGGLSDRQQEMLASYIRDTGGGLVMIGGEEAFGAGGWQGSKLEEVLPINMDIPATRMIPKGALALIVHSCEMPSGNFWGMQCAIKATEVLSPRDDVGVLSYQWKGGGGTGWDYPLAPRGDGTKVVAAIKNMQIGDMPDFDDAMNVALNGGPGQPGLAASDARQKHVIIISDGDPQAPSQALVQQYLNAQVSVSTISVYPHELPLPKTMVNIASVTGGRAYGPIEANPSQLPQIFVKEATVVRRSLITEDKDGIEVKNAGAGGGLDLLRGIALDQLPKVFGMVLTSRKENAPNIEVPLVAGPNNDPLLAYWQVGLGKVAAFTSDAHNRWAAGWVGMDAYDKFWSQLVRGVSKPAESADFEVNVKVTGDHGKITIEAVDPNNEFKNFLNIRGSVVGPNLQPIEVRAQQIRPGVYEADFPATEAGNYVVGLAYQSPDGKGGVMRSGTVVNTSPELRDLKSNLAAVQDVANRTGGRVIDLTATAGKSLFTRDGLTPSRSPLPVWDVLVPLLILLILTDIAIRRIAWDWVATKQFAAKGLDYARSFTTTRKVETTGSLDALRDVRAGKRATGTQPQSSTPDAPPALDPTRKFEAKGQVRGNLSDVVGGATDKPVPKQSTAGQTPKGQQGDKPGTGGGMSGLLDAKRRAQEEIRRREEEGK